MREPEGQQLRVEAEALGIRVRDGGEVLEAGEGSAATIHDQLAGVRCADADHEHDIHVDILFQQLGAPLFGAAGERDDVGALEHLLEVGAIGQRRGADDVPEVGAVGIDDVVVPVGLEETAVSGVVALVGGDAVGAVENGEEIGQQVDQHSTGKRPARGRRGDRRADGCADSGRVGRGMIAVAGDVNKRESAHAVSERRSHGRARRSKADGAARRSGESEVAPWSGTLFPLWVASEWQSRERETGQ